MRPHILFLTAYLNSRGVQKVDMLYTEPERYDRKADTKFSSEVTEVRQVALFEGSHNDDTSHDYLNQPASFFHSLVLTQKKPAPALAERGYTKSINPCFKLSPKGMERRSK